MNHCKVIQVIETNLRTRGDGTSKNPIRNIVEYWTLDGRLLAEVDPVNSPYVEAMNNVTMSDALKDTFLGAPCHARTDK